MKELMPLYSFYQRKIVLLVRVLLFVFFLVLMYVYSLDFLKIKLIAVLFLLFLINEVFIHFQVKRIMPEQKITKDTQNFLPSLMPLAATQLAHSPDAYQWVHSCTDEASHQLLTRLGVSFPRVQLAKEQVLDAAGKMVQSVQGTYISSLDIYTAYLYISEDQTHLLQNAGVKRQDLINLSLWLRRHYSVDEPHTVHLVFKGMGTFDFFVYGWNNQIRQFADNFTYRATALQYTPIITGRENEYKQMITALSKSSGNNVLLTGEAGTGKTSLVEHFARDSYDGVIPARLNHIMIYELLIDQLLAGIQNQGELEKRLGELIAEISHTGNTMLFIPNIENLFGAGGFDFDMSGVLLPYLEKSLLQIIGTTTSAHYAEFLENKESVTNMFEVITINEPEQETVVQMILQRLSELEFRKHISVHFSAVEQVVKLAKMFSPQKNLPGSAFDLLENVVSAVLVEGKHSIEGQDIQKFVQSKTKVLLDEPDQDEKATLLHLEEKIHQRMVNQEQAVNVVASTLRRLRSGFINEKRPISVFLFLGPTGVGKTELAKSLGAVYFGDENQMIRIDMSELKTVDGMQRILGERPGEAYIPGSLVEQVQKTPFSVVLLDEFEKADTQIHDVFLQIFDEGHVTSNKGESVSFTNTMIIATSNAGSEFIRENIQKGITGAELQKGLNEYILQSHLFKPELLNRFDDIVVFGPLSSQHVAQIARLMLDQQLKALETKELFISYDNSVIDRIVQDGYSEEYGARNIRRYITEVIEAAVSRWILQDVVAKNVHYTLSVNDRNELVLLSS